MPNRKPSKLTERSHPRYRGSSTGGGPTGGGAGGDEDASRRFALIALGGLALAAVLLVGFMMTRRSGTPATTGDATPATTATADEGLAVSTTAAPTAAPAGADAGAALDAALDANGVHTTGDGPYAAPEDQALDAAGKSYFVTFETNKGTVEAELFPEAAPITVNSFVFLARKGFYDGLTFHRVVPGFVVQGGDPQGSGMGGPGYEIKGEFNADNPIPHSVGSLAMARSGSPDSAGSQFYFVLERESAAQLDGSYAVFGQVTKGMDIVRQMAVGDTMTKVTVEEKDKSASVVSPDDVRAGKLPEGVK